MSETTLPSTAPQPTNGNHLPLQHQSPFRKWAGLGVLSLGLAIIIIDTTLLNVSLKNIINDLHTDLQSIQWVITAYALMLAAFTITGGRLGDLWGRKKMFMLGAIIFALGSFLASSSHRMLTLLMGESIIEGIGAALMMPATASLVVANFHGADRAKAFGVWGGVAGASSAIGPLLGGYLTSHYSWRWGFRINVFVAALVIIGSLLFITDSRDEEHKHTLDWGGVILSALGLLALTYGIIESETYGWWKAKELLTLGSYQISLGGISIVPYALALGIIFLIGFYLWEKRMERMGKTPLVYLDLFKNKQFTAGSITVAILTLGMTGLVFALPIFLQAVQQLDAFHTGLALLPLSGALLVMAPLSGALSRKISPTYLIQAGLVLDLIGMLVLRATLKVDMPVSHLIPGLLIYGSGMGMVMAPISNLTLSAVPMQQAGEASGVNNTLRQVGSTLGAAIIGAAVLTSLTSHLTTGIQNSPVIPEAAKTSIIQNVSGAKSNIEFGESNLPAQVPATVKTEVTNLAKQASTQATKDAYIYAAMFILMCFAVALFLPRVDVHAVDEHGQHIVDADELNHSKRKFATATVLIAVAIAGAAWLLHQSSKQTISTGATESVADIQNTFKPTVPTSTPQTTVTPPPPPSKSTPPKKVTKKPAPPKPQVAGATTPTVQTYKNLQLGFEVQLSPTWQAQEQNGHVVFVSQSGQQTSVQMYPYASDLGTIQTQLQGSPSVRSVNQSTFLGESALRFTTTSGQQGLAVIHTGKLYYIMGQLSSGPLASFKFL